VIAAACVVAFAITLSVLAAQSAARVRRGEGLAAQERAKTPPRMTASDLGLGEADFLLPSFQPPVLEPRYAPFRPRESRWTAEQVSQYWVAPRKIASDLVQSENDRAIQRLFQDVP